MPVNHKRHDDLTEKIKDIDKYGESLTEWEIDFIADLIDRPRKSLSTRQEEIIDDIYNKRIPK